MAHEAQTGRPCGHPAPDAIQPEPPQPVDIQPGPPPAPLPSRHCPHCCHAVPVFCRLCPHCERLPTPALAVANSADHSSALFATAGAVGTGVAVLVTLGLLCSPAVGDQWVGVTVLVFLGVVWVSALCSVAYWPPPHWGSLGQLCLRWLVNVGALLGALFTAFLIGLVLFWLG